MKINFNISLIIIQKIDQMNKIMDYKLVGEHLEIHLQCNLLKNIFYQSQILNFQLIS